jgi:hypothetical protein
MTVMTDKLPDTASARMAAARQRFDTAMQQARLHDRMQQARSVVQDQIAPRAASLVDTAMTRSAPVRDEAMRRAHLAALALREGEVPVVVSKRRRWPVAVGFLALGGAIGAAAAWASQAAKPVPLTPYPLPSEEPHRVDTASDSNPDLPA